MQSASIQSSSSSPSAEDIEKTANILFRPNNHQANRYKEAEEATIGSLGKYHFQHTAQLVVGISLLVSSVAFVIMGQMDLLSLSLPAVGVIAITGSVFTWLGYSSATKMDRSELDAIFDKRTHCQELFQRLVTIVGTNTYDHELQVAITEFGNECEMNFASLVPKDKNQVLSDEQLHEMLQNQFTILKAADKKLKESFANAFNKIVKAPFTNENLKLTLLIGTSLLATSVALVILAHLELIVFPSLFTKMIGGTGIVVNSWGFVSKGYEWYRARNDKQDEFLSTISESFYGLDVSINSSTDTIDNFFNPTPKSRQTGGYRPAGAVQLPALNPSVDSSAHE